MAIDRSKYLDEVEVKQLRTVTEAEAIVDLKKGRVTGPVRWMLVDLALSTGLRVSELAAIRIADIDFKRGAIKIVRAKKKKKRAETLPIDKKLIPHLKEFIAWMGKTKGPLFQGQRGPLSPQGLQQVWKAAIKIAGLPKELSIHSARHTFGVRYYRKTKDLRATQKLMGHASPSVTANMYVDVPFEDLQEGLNGLYDNN